MRIETELDEKTLRERPVDRQALEEAMSSDRDEIELLRDTLDERPARDVSTRDSPAPDEPAQPDARLDEETRLTLTRLGRRLNALRDHLMLADAWTEALGAGSEALGIWETLRRTKATFLARLRGAEVSFRAVDADRALREMDRLVELSRDERFEPYRDIAFETRGSTRWRNGSPERAIEDIRAALTIRQERGVDRLIDRTEIMLERIREDM